MAVLPSAPLRPLRIALFAPYDLARAGGVTTHIRAQARALRQLGHTVRIFGPASAPLDGGETALSRSVTVSFGGTESGLGLDPRSRSRVTTLFASEPFDIVHVHEPLVPLLPWFALRHAPSRIVATFHVHREHGHRWYPVARPWLQSLVNRVDVPVTVGAPISVPQICFLRSPCLVIALWSCGVTLTNAPSPESSNGIDGYVYG